MNILIIEDEVLILKSISKLLEKRGATVQSTTSGKEGIELILNNNYDRIITDLMLSDITGFDILEDSKSKYSKEEISKLFIIITAYSSDQILSQAQKYNCLIVNKPFDDINKTIDIFLEEIS